MSCGRVVLALLFPPLAVIDKGCGSIFLVAILTVLGWIPGTLAALIIVSNSRPTTVIYQRAGPVYARSGSMIASAPVPAADNTRQIRNNLAMVRQSLEKLGDTVLAGLTFIQRSLARPATRPIL